MKADVAASRYIA